jgi:quercetin dioxygenase-like cupin family protein
VVLDGEVTIDLADGASHVLGKLDSCFIPAGEARAIRNAGNTMATMLVVMPYAKAAA